MEFSKDTQTVIERGQAAWQRLLSKEQETWSDWLAIGEAIEEASTAMMRALGLNRPEGKRWADNFGDWLRETGFHKIDKAVRSRLKRCMEHRVQIEEWRAGLPVEKRVHYNHPTTVWRKCNEEFGVSTAIKKGPTKVEQLTAANLELQDNLDKALAEVTRLQPLAEAADDPEETMSPLLGGMNRKRPRRGCSRPVQTARSYWRSRSCRGAKRYGMRLTARYRSWRKR